MNKLFKSLSLAGVAFFAGLVLQCASDPSVQNDLSGMLADIGIGKDAKIGRDAKAGQDSKTGKKDKGFLSDSIGPKADAAGGPTRKVYSGKTDTSGFAEICGGKWTLADPPIVTVWADVSNPPVQLLHLELNSYSFIKIPKPGCVAFRSSKHKLAHYRVVVFY